MKRILRRDQFVVVGKAVDAAMTNQSFTNVALAEQLNCDESTVRHVRHGEKAKYDTYEKVCKHLGLRLENLLEGSHTVDGVSAAALGSYVRKAVEHYEGTYITIRPKYAAPEMIKVYRTRIYWNKAHDCLSFEELERRDDRDAQTGHVYFPEGPSLFLMTISNGWVRTVQVSKLIAGTKSMRGMIASQFKESGGNFTPVVAPIAFVKVDAFDYQAAAMLGELGPDHANYKFYMEQLHKTVRDGYLRVALSQRQGRPEIALKSAV
jgi:hypothetical protein